MAEAAVPKKKLRVVLSREHTFPDEDEPIPKGSVLTLDRAEATDLLADGVATLWSGQTVEAQPDWRAEAERIVDTKLAELQKSANAHKRPLPGGADEPAHVSVRDRVLDDPKMGFKSAGEYYAQVLKVGSAHSADLTPQLKAVTGHSEGVDADGGFLVPPEFRAQLLEKVYTTGQVLNPPGGAGVFNLPFTTNVVEIPYLHETSRAAGSRFGSIRVYRTPEGGGQIPEGVKFGKLILRAKKLVGAANLTEELIADNVIAVEAIVTRALSQEIAWVVDEEVFRGTGGAQMQGILNSPALLTVAKETGQAAATIIAENIDAMWARLWAPSRTRCVWFINQDVSPQLHKLQRAIGTAGQLVFMPPGGLSGAPYATLLGRPIVEIEQASTLGTLGDIVLADMSQYIYATKGGVQMAQSVHLRFDFGETVLRFTLRNDGAPWWPAPLTPAFGTATQSPFVALATRS